MRLYFYAGKCAPVYANVLADRPLGGTETGLVRLAAELSRRGHEVVVFTSHPNPPESLPRYAPLKEMLTASPCDVFIAVQDWWGLYAPIQASKRFFWTGDAGDQYLTYGIGDKRVNDKIDRLVCVSNWQAQHLSSVSGYPLEKTAVINNGVNLAWFEKEMTRFPKRLIHTPSPYRGLELLPEILKAVREIDPEIELHVFSGLEIYAREGKFVGPEAEKFKTLKNILLNTAGCVSHDNVPQEQLAKEFLSSSIFVYPCIFPETSCISAIEAMAAGCPCVATGFAALPETISDAGIIINERPGTKEHTVAFVKAICELTSDKDKWKQLSIKAKKRAFTNYSWSKVADNFESLLG